MSQNYFPFEKDGKWGFVDENSNLQISYKYDFVIPFTQGISIIKIDSKYGLINKKDQFLIEPMYDYKKNAYFMSTINGREIKQKSFFSINNFNSYFNTIILHKDGESSLMIIDTLGNKMSYSPVEYINPTKGNRDIFICRSGKKVALLNKHGEPIVPFIYDMIIDKPNGHFIVKTGKMNGLIDEEGNEILPLKYNSIIVGNYGPILSNLLIVTKNGKKGIVNYAKEMIFPIEYDDIRISQFNYICLRKGNSLEFYNSSFEKLFVAESESCNSLGEFYVALEKNRKYAILNLETGKRISEYEFEYVNEISEERIFVKKNNKSKIIDKKLNSIFSPISGGIKTYREKEIFIHQIKDTATVYNFNGEVLLKGKFRFNGFIGNELFSIKKDKDILLYSIKSKTYLSPRYRSILSIDKDKSYFFVSKVVSPQKRLPLYGIMDNMGKEVVKLKYKSLKKIKKDSKKIIASIYDTSSGKTLKGVIDLNGNVIVPIKYENIKIGDNDIVLCKSDYVSNGEKQLMCHFYNLENNTKIPNDFEDGSVFSFGKASVKINEKWGVIDETGEFVISPKYDEVIFQKEGLYRIKLEDRKGYLTGSGKEYLMNE